MKKLVIILLTSCLLFELGGYFFVYNLNRRMIRHEVRTYLKSHADKFNQQVLSFALSGDKPDDPDFIWEDRYEFSYKQEMYDIVEVTQTKDSVYFRCVRDEKENNLVSNFLKILSDKQDKRQSKNSPVSLLQILSTPFLVFDREEFDIPVAGNTCYSSEYSNKLTVVDTEVLTPPPRLI